ncbi:unnamed protein product [Clonostachys rosea]|uniref:Fucose-specific lectin n=1 Tax=Bionectria ochroleuca TaxID=29856 RepID=A0ABY6TTX8_BIOOC|nr:unnamed protein product [Clonostachys rosea]
MFNNDEEAPPPYDFIDKAIIPPGNPLAESRQHQFTSKNVTRVSPALAAPSNPILFARLFGQSSSTKLIVSTRTSLEAYNAADGTLLWQLHGRDSSIMSDGIPTQFTSQISSSYDGNLVSALVDHDAENPRFIVIDANTGDLVHRFRLHEDCGDFSCLSHMKSTLGIFYWTGDQASCIVAQPINPVAGAQPNSFWAKGVPAGRCTTMAFAPDERHIIVCQGPDVPPAGGVGDIDTRRHGQMGRNSEKWCTDPGTNKDASRQPKNMDFTVNICVYNFAKGECVRRINFPGKSSGFKDPFDVFQRPTFTPQFHFPNQYSWLVSFPDYGSASGCNIRIVDAGTGDTRTIVRAKQSMAGKMRAGSSWSLLGLDSQTEEKPTMLTTSCKTLIVTKWQEGFTGAGPVTETLTVGSGDSWSLSPDGTYLAIQRAGVVVIDIIALRRCI